MLHVGLFQRLPYSMSKPTLPTLESSQKASRGVSASGRDLDGTLSQNNGQLREVPLPLPHTLSIPKTGGEAVAATEPSAERPYHH